MLSTEQLQKEEELENYIRDFAKALLDETQIKDFAYKLKDLYSPGFRHSYSKFFPIITEIGEDTEANLEFLSNNLESLRQTVEQDYINEEKEFKGLYKPLTKLSDHLNLEIGRYNHYSEKEQRTKELEQKLLSVGDQLETAKQEVNEALPNLQQAEETLKEAQTKIESVQSELITVLSIFAAIVMTFSGGMHLLGSALTGLANITIYESVLFILSCGFVLFNLIFAMMYFIAKITGRNIYARCETPNCTCKEDRMPKCNGLTRIKKRLPYVYYFNKIIIIVLAVDFLFMYIRGLL